MKKLLLINCSPVRNGATAEILRMAQEALAAAFDTKAVCIDDYPIALCRGCRSCHLTAACVIDDGAQQLISEMEAADVILCVAPSYWPTCPVSSRCSLTGVRPGVIPTSHTPPSAAAKRAMPSPCAPAQVCGSASGFWKPSAIFMVTWR